MSNSQLPAFYLMLRFWALFGESLEYLRLFPVACSIGTVVVLMAWLQRYSHLAALLAGLLFATSPNMLRYSQELRTYSLLMLSMTIALYCVTYLLDHPEQLRGYLGLSLSLTLAASAHLVGIMMVVAVFGYYLLMIGGPKKIRPGRLFPVFALPSLVFIVLYTAMWWKLKQNTSDWWMPAPSLELIKEIADYVTGTAAIVRISSHLNDTVPGASAGIQFVLAAMGIVLIIAGKWRRSFPFLVGALIYWLPLLGYSLFVKPVFYYRTILPGLIPLIGFISFHISTVQNLKIRLTIIGGVLALNMVFISDWINNVARQPLESWQSVSEILVANWQPGDIVLYYPNYAKGPVDYYWTPEPAAGQFEIKYPEDVRGFEAAIDDLPSAQTAGNLPNLYLIIRWDAVAKKDDDTRRQLLSAVQSGSARFVSLHVIFVLYHDPLSETERVSFPTDELSEPLAQLETLFGPPFTAANSKLLVWTIYEPSSLR
jgi:hypothetical protein